MTLFFAVSHSSSHLGQFITGTPIKSAPRSICQGSHDVWPSWVRQTLFIEMNVFVFRLCNTLDQWKTGSASLFKGYRGRPERVTVGVWVVSLWFSRERERKIITANTVVCPVLHPPSSFVSTPIFSFSFVRTTETTIDNKISSYPSGVNTRVKTCYLTRVFVVKKFQN